jgi:hypothetical protein
MDVVFDKKDEVRHDRVQSKRVDEQSDQVAHRVAMLRDCLEIGAQRHVL